eukprot:30738-Pelagomonas_calceolata.AAC.1
MDEDSDLLHLTTDAQWQRAVKFEAEVNQAKAEGRQAPDATIVGIRGLSLFPGILWYSDCNTLFTMPFCHKQDQEHDDERGVGCHGGEGGAEGCEHRMLAPPCIRKEHTLSHAERVRLRACHNSLTITQDFGRPVRCIDPYIKALTSRR